MASILSRIVRRLKYGRPVVIVSGLPRSGTSMAMKMLEAGGMELVVDNIRTADEDNPKGYYEDERVKDLAEMKDKEWLDGARGKVIKVTMYESHLEKVQFQLRFRPYFEAIYLDFASVVAEPEREARRIAAFVGGGLDVDRMAAAVDGSLYRNRRTADGAVAGQG
ncbi:MAG: hypothetical protein IFK92_13350 [Acidobacteria bacterium]|nr:hypothetical protein [Candidatus Sulfomarinibacter kjeldsenii]